MLATPVQVGNMSEFLSWADKNWYALGTLLIELFFLVAAVWFARNILKTLRAFQEQVGALLKLTITATPDERQLASNAAKRFFAESSPDWLAPSETQTAKPPEPIPSDPSRFLVAWRRLAAWMQAPISAPKVRPGRSVIKWLQGSVGTPSSGRKGAGSGLLWRTTSTIGSSANPCCSTADSTAAAPAQTHEHAASSTIGLALAEPSPARTSFDPGVNQALGGRLKPS